MQEVYCMNQEKLIDKMSALEREIAILPDGSITKKKIRDKEYYYHRVTKDGKRVEIYIDFDDVENLRVEIKKRRELEKQLKNLRNNFVLDKYTKEEERNEKFHPEFKTMVRTGKHLASMIAITMKYKKRECIEELRNYIFGGQQDKVFIIYGLRRTGKTTMIRQILTELSESEFEKAAFIQVKSSDALADLSTDLGTLEGEGYKYVFIDEVTLMEDFIEGAAIFSDIYASSGMKIVLSGTDSLGFIFSKEEQLYDRCIMLHTTFIPYREFEEVLGVKGIDEYIRYGGTMSLGGVNYNQDAIFMDEKSTEKYIDTAIAKNIQHSLKMYQDGGHFRQLLDLYESGELTNVINRVVENMNHSFTRNVVEKTFKSHDISVTARNLLKDKESPINIKEHMDLDVVTFGIMQALDILNKEELLINIESSHMEQIKEYLTLLDLVAEIDLEYLPEVNQKGKVVVITQPGMRYAQANTIVEQMLLDSKFMALSLQDRQRVLDRLRNEIRGRMMEDIVLLETKTANPEKYVFKLQFTVGEFDMVVFDSKALNCQIYEVKYSKEQVKEQYRQLIDKDKCNLTEHRFGDITERYVIYRGDAMEIEGVKYLNVEEYLKTL